LQPIGKISMTLLSAATCTLALGACSSDDTSEPPGGGGGAIGVGGAVNSGGLPAGSGGAVPGAGGGPTGTGAGPATGGTLGTGGATPVSTGGAMTGSGGAVPGSGGAAPASGGATGVGLPPVDKVDVAGPFVVAIDESAGPNKGWVAHPKELGKDGLLHPLFTWGCGGGSQPSQYKDHLTFWASHGFVVEAHVSTGDGKDHKAAVDWLIAENTKADSQYFGKLNTTKIAAGGHSQGSISTFAFEGTETRLTTTIHVAGGSFDGMGYKNLKTPTLMVDGSGDTLALSNTKRDYEATTVPVFLTVIEGGSHVSAARDGLAPIVAWLRWHLGGEVQRKSMFVGPNCDFCTGKYVSQSKNW
jgi:hypothetical protein